MWPGEFLFRSLLLSFIVALFWMPVLAITGYGLSAVFDIFSDQPIGLGMIIVLFALPLGVLLSVLAIRGGLMVLRVTDGSDIAKIFSVTFRILRFNVPLMLVIIALFGVATTYSMLHIGDRTFLDDMANASANGGASKSYVVAKAAEKFPVIASAGWVFGYCVAFAAMGVSMAAAAAMAVSKPPHHHTIWGVGAQFLNLFVLAICVLFIPFMLFVFAFGGFSLDVEYLLNIDPKIMIAGGIFALWASSALYAGAALAYANHLQYEEVRHDAVIASMSGLGDDRPKVDLAALRKSRMHDLE